MTEYLRRSVCVCMCAAILCTRGRARVCACMRESVCETQSECTYARLCVCRCLSVCESVCVHARAYVWDTERVHVRPLVYVSLSIYLCVTPSVCLSVCMWVCVREKVRVRVYVCVRARACALVFMHICVYISYRTQADFLQFLRKSKLLLLLSCIIFLPPLHDVPLTLYPLPSPISCQSQVDKGPNKKE